MMKRWVPAIALTIGVMTVLVLDSYGGSTKTPELRTQSGFISVPNGRLYYEEAGQGACIVFLHDGLFHSEIYDSQFIAFADRYRVIRYDRRGYGRSDNVNQPHSRIADLKAVCDTLGIDSALIIGCSSGSRLAIDFTLKYPSLVTGLVLIGPVVSGMPYTNHMYTRGGRLRPEILTDLDSNRDYWVDRDPYEFDPANSEAKARARILLTAFPQDLDFRKDRWELPPDRPAIRFLSEIKVPTLIIVGEGDIPDVHAHAGAVEAGIANSRREIISHAGHLPAFERPQETSNLIRSFLLESTFLNMILREGVSVAVKNYQASLAHDQGTRPMPEASLNRMGYQSLQVGKNDDALTLFKLAVDIYPNSFNVYDSYGEALLASGDTTGAVANYRRSLELNPDNANAVQVLQILRTK